MGVDTITHPTAPKGICPVCHGTKWAIGNNGNPNLELPHGPCAICKGTGKV